MLTRAEPDTNTDARSELAAPALRIEAVDAARLVALLDGPLAAAPPTEPSPPPISGLRPSRSAS